MDSGAPIERIYAMCSAPVSVGVRHDIEATAEAASGVPVELLDGKWIAEQLADNELIWIARRYLELSDAMMPLPEPSASEVDDYTELRDRWRMAATPRPLPGDFHELRAGVRMAAEPGPCRADLPMWLNRMEQMLQPHIDPELRARVQYELAVGALIGQRDLRPMDDHVRTYFLEKVGWDHPLRLNDASVLLTYLYGMVATGRTTLLPDDLAAWHSALLTHLEGLLDEHPAPTRRAYLRFTIGCLKLQPSPQLIEVPNAPIDLPEIDVIRKEYDEKGVRGADGLLDPSGGIKEWQTLLDELAPSGNLFPLEQLANTVSLMTGVLIDVNGWDELVTALDRALTTKSGMATAAGQAFARAQKLMHLDRPLAAIQALHAAKVDWFAGDSLHETFDALMGLSRCYMELRLPMAAKQYALAACHLCVATDRDDVRDLYPTALNEVARVEFYSGRWLAATRAAVAALNGHRSTAPPAPLDWHLLQAIHGIVVGYRVPENATDWTTEQATDFALAEESPDAPEVPLGLFSYDGLRTSIGVGALATLQIWGLHLRTERVDPEAVLDFLGARYAHRTDDVPHDDLFIKLAEAPNA